MSDTYRIKPLVWEWNPQRNVYRAGAYTALHAWGSWGWGCYGDDWGGGTSATLEAAKAACEAHRLERLMPHLERVD